MDRSKIRNFGIIAHIDHGKSTLADRILEICRVVPKEKMKEQFLDRMDLERERGITIKAKAVRMEYFSPRDGEKYILNLIDTPGHADFSYEVSRSLAACEGVLLVVDASQGVEAQTLAHARLAISQGLVILPVINKIDLSSADPERAMREVEAILGEDHLPFTLVSAKLGTGVEELIEKIVQFIPPPQGEDSPFLQALIFDSIYDSYRGVIPFIRVKEGKIKKGMEIMMFSTRKSFSVSEVGVFTPERTEVDSLGPGEVGYVVANINQLEDSQVGDTITSSSHPSPSPIPGYRKIKPLVFCSFYPVSYEDHSKLKEALERLQLNDAALSFEADFSEALGFGFRCGFLGLLHMDITQERMEREFGVEVVATAPHAVYHVLTKKGEVLEVRSPKDFPPPSEIEEAEEPYVEMSITVPAEYLGGVMDLCQSRRGIFKDMIYLSEKFVLLKYDLPLAEILLDFYDRLKAVSRGYASLDYEFAGYRPANLVRVDILVNREKVDGLSFISPEENAYYRGRELISRLKELIPRQLFTISLQAAVGGKIIAREDIPALRKDVLQKCYGGDITRKRKLLEKQKEGKKRMKAVGKVKIPQEAFLAVMKSEK
ncbi:translation elongation factor 4 [Candidatus Sordicultor fermentans]|uniref:translation elongation factor 4 n=1 Tax=Candidatus Sordicultor fermentans TaxID=1953203 RepID=UPI0016B8821F|nr:elongation factor 4 [Candidatus Atribacteria bacterium]